MKKYFVLFIILMFLSAGNAFAGATIAQADNDASGGNTLAADSPAVADISKMSKGVIVTAITSLTGYSLYTAHLNGSKSYGSAHDSTALFTQAFDPDTGLATPGAVGAVEFATEWTAL